MTKSYKCTKCGYVFQNSYLLKVHLTKRKWPCDIDRTDFYINHKLKTRFENFIKNGYEFNIDTFRTVDILKREIKNVQSIGDKELENLIENIKCVFFDEKVIKSFEDLIHKYEELYDEYKFHVGDGKYSYLKDQMFTILLQLRDVIDDFDDDEKKKKYINIHKQAIKELHTMIDYQ